MHKKRLIRRMASDNVLTELIKNASTVNLADALSDVLNDYITISDDPWENARDAVDRDYIIDKYVSNAENIMDEVRGMLGQGNIIEFNRYDGQIENVYATLDDAINGMDDDEMEDFVNQYQDADDFCIAYNNKFGFNTWLVTKTCFDKVRKNIIDEAKDAGDGDGDWDSHAKDWMYDNGIDENADYVFYIESENKYICCNDDKLVDTVLKLCSTDDQRDALKANLLHSE